MVKCINGEDIHLNFKNKYYTNIVLSHDLYPYAKSHEFFKINFKFKNDELINKDIKIYGANVIEKDNNLYSNGGRILSIVSNDTNLYKSLNKSYNFIKSIDY